MKPTRLFVVCTAPLVVSTDDGHDVLVPPMRHKVSGSEIKYVHGDPGFYQVVDRVGTVVWTCPFHQLLWCRVDDAVESPLEVVPLDEIDEEEVDEEEVGE